MDNKIQVKLIQKAARLARVKFKELWDGDEHPSFAQSKALEYAAQWLEDNGVPNHGVEGFAFPQSCTHGVEYINFGDPYDYTVLAVVRGGGFKHSIETGCWASYA